MAGYSTLAAATAEGRRAVPPAEFVDPLARFCKGAGIRTRVNGGHVYLLNVRLSVVMNRGNGRFTSAGFCVRSCMRLNASRMRAP